MSVCLIAEHEEFSATDTETVVSFLFCFNLYLFSLACTHIRRKVVNTPFLLSYTHNAELLLYASLNDLVLLTELIRIGHSPS